MDLDLARQLHRPAQSKILLLVMDGLGGLSHPETGKTELETARTPNLDALAARSDLGQTLPVGYVVTPGSGPGHLALFGYDPMQVQIGRGVLEAVGINFDLDPSDVAARGNFCTLDSEGRIIDRRAGRIPTAQSAEIVKRLNTLARNGDIQTLVAPVQEHRFVLVLRGSGLSEAVTETDPQQVGVLPLTCNPLETDARRTADAVNVFVEQARGILAGESAASGLTLRGFAKTPSLPSLQDVWGLRAASCAIYPMYRGLAKLAGMQALNAGSTFADQIAALRNAWNDYDYFFLHYKYTDSAGEDGDFDAKVARLEDVDAQLPSVLELQPDVLMISGDHSTPSVMAAHSWHPVPFLLHGAHVRADHAAGFSEMHCARGALGTFPAKEALPLAMAQAGRLAKFGA